jgi:hypothetical protein
MGLTATMLLALATIGASPERSPLDPVGKIHIPIGIADSLDSLKTFVEAEGGFSPGFATFGVSCWIFDPILGKLHAGTDGRPVEHGLNGVGRLIPWSQWSAGDIRVWSETCQAEREVAGKVLQFVGAKIRLRNVGRESRTFRLFVAIRPVGPAGGPIHAIELVEAGRIVTIDGHVAASADPAPAAAGAIASDSIGEFAWRGEVPDARSADSPTGDCSALLRFDVTLSRGESRIFRLVCPVLAGRRAVGHRWDGVSPWAQLDKAVPRPTQGGVLQPDLSIDELKSVRADDLFYRAESYWDDIGGRVKLRLPDRRWAEAFAAITSHVAVAMNDGAADVAVTNYNVFNRDGVYVTNILQKSGRPDLAERAIDYFLAHPFNGRVQPEADNPGQVLWIMGEHWRFTHDRGWLLRVKPAVNDLAAMIRSFRTEPGPHWVAKSGRGFGPKLSPKERVELKPGACDGVHPEYTEAFDIAGLRAAAILASGLGDTREAAERQTLADELLASYGERFGDRLAHDYGRYCVLWPCRLYPSSNGKAFAQFRTVAAQQPASWRYFPLATAHQGLLARNRAAGFETINLHLASPQMKDWYAFDEGGKSGAGGWHHARTTWSGDVAMPHGWAIAEFHLLLRDSLAFEDGDQLILLAGIPPAWFRDPAGFSIEKFLTVTDFGAVAIGIRPVRRRSGDSATSPRGNDAG